MKSGNPNRPQRNVVDSKGSGEGSSRLLKFPREGRDTLLRVGTARGVSSDSLFLNLKQEFSHCRSCVSGYTFINEMGLLPFVVVGDGLFCLGLVWVFVFFLDSYFTHFCSVCVCVC